MNESNLPQQVTRWYGGLVIGDWTGPVKTEFRLRSYFNSLSSYFVEAKGKEMKWSVEALIQGRISVARGVF